MLLRQKNVIVNARTMDPHWCRLVRPLQHQTDCSDRYFREYEGIFRIIFYHCQNKSGLIISFGVGIPVKLASIDRAVSYLVNLNQLQDLKFDIVCDNGVSLQTKVVYMKFPNESLLLLVGAMGHFTPISHQQQLCRQTFFLKSCMWVTCNNKQTNEMQNICNFQIFSKSPLLYPKFVQIFQIGPKHIIDFQQASEIMIVFKHFFPKRFSIKFCIWKSSRFFSLHLASPLKMAQGQNGV